MLNFSRTNAADIEYLAANLRQEEVREIWASHLQTPEELLPGLVERSFDVYTAHNKDTIVAITGVTPLSLVGGWASPWLLTADTLVGHPRLLLIGTRIMLDKWKSDYVLLENHVDARYEQSIRWAKWAGFTVHEPQPYGPLGLPFHRIEIRS